MSWLQSCPSRSSKVGVLLRFQTTRLSPVGPDNHSTPMGISRRAAWPRSIAASAQSMSPNASVQRRSETTPHRTSMKNLQTDFYVVYRRALSFIVELGYEMSPQSCYS